MDLYIAVILGIIQGITEWLPVSSEGLLSLVMITFLGKELPEGVFFSLWLHIGSLFATLIYFRKDISELLQNLPSYINSPNTYYSKLTTFLIISTILTAAIGAPLLLFGLGGVSGKLAMLVIGLLLLITGFMQFRKVAKGKLIDSLNKSDSIITGIAQGFSVLPGLSRSGITTGVLLLRKYSSRRALKLSFIMSIPAVFIAELGIILTGNIVLDTSALLAALFSFIFGFLTIKLMLKITEKINFGWFCILIGLLSITAFLI